MLALIALAVYLAQGVENKLGIESIFPTSIGGWLAVLAATGLLIDRIRNRGKKEGVDEATVNGLGSRVKAVEANHERLEGQFAEHQRSVDRVLLANENLLKEVGRAERSAGLCREDTEKYTIEIGSKVDALRRDVLAEVSIARREFTDATGTINVELGKLATEVRLRAEFDARDRGEV